MGKSRNLEEELARARGLAQAGHFGQAEQVCMTVLSLHPNHLGATLLLSDLATKTGRDGLAIQTLTQALAHHPFSVDILLRLGQLLRQAGAGDRAVELCRQATKLNPQAAEAWFLLGLCALDIWLVPEAISAFEKAVQLSPATYAFADRLGFALNIAGETEKSLAAYRRAGALAANDPTALVSEGILLEKMGRSEEAEVAFEAAEKRGAAGLASTLALARAYASADKSDAAVQAYKRSLQLKANDLPSILGLSSVLQEQGNFSEAKEILKKATTLYPTEPRLYLEFVSAGKVTTQDAEMVDNLQKQLDPASAQTIYQLKFHQAMGKALDDLGQYEEAISAYRTANSLAPPHWGLSAAAKTEHIEFVEILTAQPVTSEQTSSEDDLSLIFVVGMPRSGTTLTEQILARNPCVATTGEHTYINSIARRLTVNNPSQEELQTFREGYLRLAKFHAGDSQVVVDKTPENYFYLGLLHRLFPTAKFIHCRRSPIDTCLSMYVTPLTAPYKYKFEDLAFGYHMYERVMEHWRTKLPASVFYESDYEALVSDPENQIPLLQAFVGLGEKSEVATETRSGDSRVVKTPSRWQVRQPINTGSVQRWRRYAPWIQDLLAEFPEEAGEELKR